MFSPGREEEERARARAEEAYTSQLREWQDDEEGDEVRTGWPDGRSHRPNRKLGRYFEPLGDKNLLKKHQKPKFWGFGDIFFRAFIP